MKTRNYRNYTDQDILDATSKVKSLAGLLKELGLRCAGGNFDNMKRNLQRLEADTSHWTGQGWNKDQQLKDWSQYTRGIRLKPHLIRARGHQCQSCLLSEWLEKPITLELEHCDGNKTNNDPSNLLLLCPNCHSQTPTWKRGMVGAVGVEPTV